MQIWGSENAHVVMKHVRGNPKVNVWCDFKHRSFLFNRTYRNCHHLPLNDATLCGTSTECPATLRHFQHDGAPPHWRLLFWVPGWNISGQMDWRQRRHTLTTKFDGNNYLNFFMWGYVKDKVYTTRVSDINTLRRMVTGSLCYPRYIAQHKEWN